MRVARLLLPLSLLLFALSAAPALASTQIGQLGAPYEGGQCANNAVFQRSVETGATPYSVPAGGGVITSWQTRTGKYAGSVKLKVFRATAKANEFFAVGEDGPQPVAQNQTSPLFTGVRVPVQAGDMLGLVGYGTNCNSSRPGENGYQFSGYDINVDPLAGTTTPIKFNGSLYALEILANVEPDADLDLYGDETQDACPADATTQTLPCPVKPIFVAPPPPDTKAPQIALSSKAKQDAVKAKAVIATATADEAVTFTATGSVNVPGAGAFSLTPSTVAGAANAKTSIRLGLTKSVKNKIATALKNGKKVSASIHVIAKDAAGNPSNATQSVTIKKSTPKKHPK